MNNPFSKHPLTDEQAERVEQLRTIRRNAKKASRSGHPGRRADALKALAICSPGIRAIYVAAARKAEANLAEDEAAA